MNESAKKVFESPVSPRAKLLYLYLYGHANNKGRVISSYKTLGEKLNSTRNTLSGALKELVQTGLIEKENRLRKDGGKASNVYTICNWSHDNE